MIKVSATEKGYAMLTFDVPEDIELNDNEFLLEELPEFTLEEGQVALLKVINGELVYEFMNREDLPELEEL